jgi:hypothetical protein
MDAKEAKLKATAGPKDLKSASNPADGGRPKDYFKIWCIDLTN